MSQIEKVSESPVTRYRILRIAFIFHVTDLMGTNPKRTKNRHCSNIYIFSLDAIRRKNPQKFGFDGWIRNIEMRNYGIKLSNFNWRSNPFWFLTLSSYPSLKYLLIKFNLRRKKIWNSSKPSFLTNWEVIFDIIW